MTAQCQIPGCHMLIVGADPPPQMINAANENESIAMRNVQCFDLLALAMLQHLMRSHPDKSQELMAVQFLAGKVYAMTWAESSAEIFDDLRESWKTTVLNGLTSTFSAQSEAGALAVSSGADPSESKVKKSSKNFSN